MSDGLGFTPHMLAALGKKVVNGMVVDADAPEPSVAEDFARPEFPDQRGSWCLRGVWYRAPAPDIEIHNLESVNQRQIVGYWRSLKCTVGSLSQVRRSKVALGTPDLWMFGNERTPIYVWWETKTPWGSPHTKEQIEFALNCARTGTVYGTGNIATAIAFAHAIGLRA